MKTIFSLKILGCGALLAGVLGLVFFFAGSLFNWKVLAGVWAFQALSPEWFKVLLGNLIYAPLNLFMAVVAYKILDWTLLGRVRVSEEIKQGNWTVTVFVTVVIAALLLSGKTAVGGERGIDKLSPYQNHIDRAHARFFGRGSAVPARLISSQFYQESRFNRRAVSPAGARGVAQIMPGTQGDIEKRLGTFNAFNARDSIYAGTWYFQRMYHNFRRGGKTTANRIALALASYNCGIGYVLKAQKIAGPLPSQRWRPVARALPQVPRVHAEEPIDYVKKIFHFYHTRFRARRDPLLRVT